MRSGQLDAPPGFGHWLLKFDGVSGNKDKDLEDPQGYGVVEDAYSQMAQAAGITMSECRLRTCLQCKPALTFLPYEMGSGQPIAGTLLDLMIRLTRKQRGRPLDKNFDESLARNL